MKPLKVAARAGLALCATFSMAAADAQAQGTHHQGAHHPTRHVTHQAGAHKPHHGNATKYPVKKPAAKNAGATMTLSFYNVHTNESTVISRRQGDALSPQQTWFMRDYRRGQTIKMDPKLFDLLGKLKTAIQQKHPNLSVQFQVVSSYRTPATNEGLRAAGGSQAEHSQHMLGKAMDIRVPGLSTIELRDIATCLKGGGVGYYAEDQFVHVDVGRVRYWPSHDYLATLNCNASTKPKIATRRANRYPQRG